MKKSFQGLRSFFTGQEGEEEMYFAYSATLRIFGDHLDFDEIGHSLRLQPTHSHKKGERRRPKLSESLHDMWQYSPPVPEDHPLSEHIDTLWADIQHAKAYLCALKETATVDVFLGYRSNCGTAGVEVPHTCLAMFVELEIPFGLSIIIT